MNVIVTTHEAKSQLSKLIVKVHEGHEVIICRGSQPTARLIAYEEKGGRRLRRPQVGTITSEPVTYDEDTFAPLTEKELEEWGI